MRTPLPLISHPDPDSRVRALERDGFVYFDAVLDAGEVAELRTCMDGQEAMPESFDRHSTAANGAGFLNKVINNVFNRDPLLLPYLDKPEIIDVAEAVHGEDCHVIGMSAWLTGPGRPDQNLHTDWLPLSLPEDILADPRVRLPIFITTAHFYLDDMTEELGPTSLVPGSHRSGRSPEGDTDWNGIDEQSVLCDAGDVVLFRCDVWHRGTANRSTKTRYLLQVHYARRMIAQKYPPYLHRFQFEEDILARATPRQRRLLGEHRPGDYD